MSLPKHVRDACRVVMNQPASSMKERASNVHAKAYEYGYLWDHVERKHVYVGDAPEKEKKPA